MKHVKNFILTTLIIFICTFYLFLLSTALSRCSYADDFKVLELNEVTLNYKNYEALGRGSRNMLLYPETAKEAISLNVNVNILHCLFWNGTIQTLTTDAQYRTIGLEARYGIRLLPQLDIGVYHNSQHLLERQHSYMDRFPVEDAIEVRLNLFKKEEVNSLFGD